MKKKSIIIVVASVLLLAAAVLIFVIFKNIDNNKLDKKLSTIATDYYENEAKEFVGDKASYLGYYIITLDTLKEAGKDIKSFEDHSCDMIKTYAKLVFNDDETYKVNINLACEK